MINNLWIMNVISLLLVITSFITSLILYLHMNQSQKKEGRNISSIIICSISFAALVIILTVDIFIEYSKDKRTANQKKLDKMKKIISQ